MRILYCIQVFTAEKWQTAHVSSYLPDSEHMLSLCLSVTDKPIRLVSFSSPSLDFIAVHAHDFAVLERSD